MATYQVEFDKGDVQVGPFDELAGDFDFESMDEVDAILGLEVGQCFTTVDNYATWTRIGSGE
jgi:hypothetical protein